MVDLKLQLESLKPTDDGLLGNSGYSYENLRRASWRWDKIVKGSSHLTNCAYQRKAEAHA